MDGCCHPDVDQVLAVLGPSVMRQAGRILLLAIAASWLVAGCNGGSEMVSAEAAKARTQAGVKDPAEKGGDGR